MNNKIKLNSGLAAVILLTCLFSGWSTLLTVTVLMFLFCEVDDKVKGVAVKVIAFFAGLTLVSLGWGLIMDAFHIVYNDVNDLVGMLNSLLSTSIDLSKIYQYILNPVNSVLAICDDLVGFFISMAKFFFIVNVLRNKPMKENLIVKKINEFVANVVNYINNIDMGTPVAPAAPAAPVAPTPEAPVQQ